MSDENAQNPETTNPDDNSKSGMTQAVTGQDIAGLQGLRRLFGWPLLLILCIGSLLSVVGIETAGFSDFATPRFMIGLTLHLLGVGMIWAGCFRVVRRSRRAYGEARESLATPASPSPPHQTRRLRAAEFHFGIKFVRFAVALLLVSTAAASLGRAGIDLYELYALRRRGQVVQGQVFNKERAAELGNATTGLIYYSFRGEGRSVTGRFRTARANYPQFFTGRRLTVTFLPGNPGVHRLGLVDADRVGQEALALLLLLLTCVADAGIPLFLVDSALRQQLRLARYGVVVTGVILGCKPVVRAGRRVGYRVRYGYELPNGRLVGGNARIRQLEGEPTLVGFPLTVLYDPRHPERSRPLAAFHLVRFRGLQKTLLAV